MLIQRSKVFNLKDQKPFRIEINQTSDLGGLPQPAPLFVLIRITEDEITQTVILKTRCLTIANLEYTKTVDLADIKEKKESKFIQFQRIMPECCSLGFDSFSHKNISDLFFLAQHELDLYEEGEETDIKTKRLANSVKSFMDKCEKEMNSEVVK